jgi:hypothetical protein
MCRTEELKQIKMMILNKKINFEDDLVFVLGDLNLTALPLNRRCQEIIKC